MKRAESVVFKRYEMGQPQLLPPSVEELIPEKQLVRVINKVIDQMALTRLIEEYKGGWAEHHPIPDQQQEQAGDHPELAGGI